MSNTPMQWELETRRTALIVVDMQKLFCESHGALYVPRSRDIVGVIQRLIAAARTARMPVIYLRHVVRGDGTDTGRMRDLYPDTDEIMGRQSPDVEIIDSLAPEVGDIIVNKPIYSGFYGTDLDNILRANDIDTVILCGTVTNVCCETTARDAMHREYKVIFLSDATAAMDYPDMGWGAIAAEDIQRMTLTVMAYEFGQVSDSTTLIAQIKDSAIAATPKL